ncbi:MAG: YlcI/YnfO family protein [Sulfurisoma sp.]|nr:YlcI/YnfO family protein [Sulfurisoma sp.]
MKSATIPSVRVEPELRGAIEAQLQEGESLSSFVEQALRDSVESRRLRSEFIARGLLSRDEARSTGRYVDAGAVVQRLEIMLAAAKATKPAR